jgi:hypothetical protein
LRTTFKGRLKRKGESCQTIEGLGKKEAKKQEKGY